MRLVKLLKNYMTSTLVFKMVLLDDKMVGESLYQNINKIEYDHENKM